MLQAACTHLVDLLKLHIVRDVVVQPGRSSHVLCHKLRDL
jgi:hypothetical protein